MAVEITPAGSRGRTFPGGLFRVLMAVNVVLYRALRGRGMSRLGILTTVGAKTGQVRTIPLASFDAGNGGWWIVASKGGAIEHPAWYINLAQNPDDVHFEVDGRRYKVTPRSLTGAEREAAWKQVVTASSNFAGYKRATDREIPVVLLTPEG